MQKRGGRYSEEEVRALIEGYAELRARVDTTRPGLRYLVMLLDLDRALTRLPHRYREAVFLHGLLGLNSAQVAELLRVSPRAARKRYQQALDELHFQINGGE